MEHPKGSWGAINWQEFFSAVISAGGIGMIRVLYLIQKGRQFRWIDIILEPSLAIVGGLLVWMLLEVTDAPDMIQAVMTSLGAWGGPRTINMLEKKYLGDQSKNTKPGDLDGPI